MTTDKMFATLRRPYQIVRLPLRPIEDQLMALLQPLTTGGLYRWARESLAAVGLVNARGSLNGERRTQEYLADELAVKRDNARRLRLQAREIAEYEAIEEAWAATRDRMRLASEAAQEATAAASWKAQEEATRVAREAAEALTRGSELATGTAGWARNPARSTSVLVKR